MMKLTQLYNEIEKQGIPITATTFALQIKIYRLIQKIIKLQS